MSADVEQRIRERAYSIWLERGCPEGCDQDHWLEAEQALRSKSEPQADVVAEPAAVAAAKPARKPRTRKVAAA